MTGAERSEQIPDEEMRRIAGLLPPKEFAHPMPMSYGTILDIDDGRYRIHKLRHQTWCADRGIRCVGHATTQEDAMRLVEHDMSMRRDRMHRLLHSRGFRISPEGPDHARASHGETRG